MDNTWAFDSNIAPRKIWSSLSDDFFADGNQNKASGEIESAEIKEKSKNWRMIE